MTDPSVAPASDVRDLTILPLKAVWKYPLVITDRQPIALPAGAQIRTVQLQAGVVCVWAEVEPAARLQPRTIVIVGTGHTLPTTALVYLGSVQQGPFVWHVYEEVA